MKANSVIRQLSVKIAIILFIGGIVTIFVSSYLSRMELESYRLEQIQRVTKVASVGVESAGKFAKTIERQIDRRLLIASKEIANQFQGKTVDQISKEDLAEQAKRWDLYGISLFVRQGDDIVVAQSTLEKEIGLSSKDWGYWYTAFDQLMADKEVTVGRGYGTDNFWVGPISKSEWDNKYFKYAYYYDGTSDFMINPFILDEDIYNLTFNTGLSQMIDKILEQNGEIEAIEVINAPAWLKGKDNKVIEPLTDLPMLYGRHQYGIAQDDRFIRQVWTSGMPASEAFLSEGRSLKKFYEPLPENRVLVIVMNMERQEQFKSLFITTLSSAFVLIFLCIFVMIQAVARSQLHPLKLIAEHIDLASEGDLSHRLQLQEDNEWGRLSEQINDATQKVGALIWKVKKDIESLSVLSSLLTKRVYASLDTMNELSVHMTHEAKSSLVEVQAHMELLKQSLNALVERPPGGSARENRDRLETEIAVINGHMQHLSDFLETHTNQVTSFGILLFGTLQELTAVIENMDKLSMDLKEKIEVFHVYEDNT